MADLLDQATGIEPLRASDAPGCVEVVRSLPEWFGYPGALDDVGAASRTQEGFCARLDGRVIGFVTIRPSYAECLEVTYLAVHATFRRRGLGRALIRAVARLCGERSIDSICLLTLGPTAESPFYNETVEFYRTLGFWRVRELQNAEWGCAYSLVMAAPADQLID